MKKKAFNLLNIFLHQLLPCQPIDEKNSIQSTQYFPSSTPPLSVYLTYRSFIKSHDFNIIQWKFQVKIE